MKTTIPILLLFFVFSCKQRTEIAAKEVKFVMPNVSQLCTENLKQIDVKGLRESYPYFLGEYDFTDSIFISGQPDANRSKVEFFNRYYSREEDSFSKGGLEIYADYGSSVCFEYYGQDSAELYYPVYIVNSSPCTKVMTGKDSHIYGIQEAMDSFGFWRAIEVKPDDFCGNGVWNARLKPGKFFLALFPRYSGDFKTMVRVRVRNDEQVFLSEPFQASINYGQFHFRDSTSHLFEEQMSSAPENISRWYYGAYPLDLDKRDLRMP